MVTNPFEAFRHAGGGLERGSTAAQRKGAPSTAAAAAAAVEVASGCAAATKGSRGKHFETPPSHDHEAPAALREVAGNPAAGHGTKGSWLGSSIGPTSATEDVASHSPAKRARIDASSGGNGSKAPGRKSYEGPGLIEKLGNDDPQPLRLIIVGHNPSEEAWRQGHVYAHRSNRMWPILIKTGIAPPGTKGPEADDSMPRSVGVGFCDVGTGHPGTDSREFKSEVFVQWQKEFYGRLRRHVAAACAAIGCTCGTCGAPALVAFSGKRHYLELLNIGKKGKSKVKTVPLGRQPRDLLPPGWPFSYEHTEVYVCTSTSGATPLTNQDREAPYMQLAERLAQIPWPCAGLPRCKDTGG